MDMSSGEWLADLGSEDGSDIIQHCHMMMMNSNVHLERFNSNLLSQQPTDLLFDESNDFNIISSLENQQKHDIIKEMKNENDIDWSSYTSSNNSSEKIISFGCFESGFNNKNIKYEEDLVNYESGASNNNALIKDNSSHQKLNKHRVGSTSLSSQEHVLAERRRREKMTERFVALSALIPGLKKMDKASILGDAAKYVKQLEKQLKTQEEEITKRKVDSFVLLKKNQHNYNNINNSNNNNNNNNNNNDNNNNNNNNIDYTSSNSSNELVEIEAKISNKNVLIRIHSQKKEGLVQFLLNEIGNNLHMSILNCISIPFGRYAIDITIIAEIENEEKKMSSNEVIKQLGLALQQFTSL